MSRSVLIVDDEATLAKNIKTYLTRYGFEARTAATGEQGLQALESFQPDVVLLDYQLGDSNGLQILQTMQTRDPRVKVFIMTAYGGIKLAVEAIKAGAYDYVSKPVVLEELRLMLDKVIGQERIEDALAYYQHKEAERSGLDKLIGESAPMCALKNRIQRFIEAEQRVSDDTPPAVLITGETGTGKELAARALHFDGQRRNKPFVEINCAAIPAQLIESELFGYERGAFTDARERKAGLVETADGGTLFLDEIGEMDLASQAKLLKLLEDKRVRRLGGLRDQHVDVRIIAATNQDLEARVRQGTFRSDLLFRLRIITLDLPPLRQRGDDILLLANMFLSMLGKRYGRSNLDWAPEAQTLLKRHAWPGNVRELRNSIEQAVLLAESDCIAPAHLSLKLTLPGEDVISSEQDLNLERLEVRAIIEALNRTDWNVSQAALLLGISRDTLRYRMDKHELKNPSFAQPAP